MNFGREAVRAFAVAVAIGYPGETFAQKGGSGEAEAVESNPLEGAAIDACSPEGALQISEGMRRGESMNGLRILTSITVNSARGFDDRGEPVEGYQHVVDMVASVSDCTPQDFDAAEVALRRLVSDAEAVQYFEDVIVVLRQAYSEGGV